MKFTEFHSTHFCVYGKELRINEIALIIIVKEILNSDLLSVLSKNPEWNL